MERALLARYHRAVVSTLGENADRVIKSEVGRLFAEDFISTLDGKKLEFDDFSQRFVDYLQKDLQFADEVSLSREGDEVTLATKGCHLCFGNDLLRKEGKTPACPYIKWGCTHCPKDSAGSRPLKQSTSPVPLESASCGTL